MAYCQGCGRYVGEYSAYRQNVPGKGEIVLCYRCTRWANRHPGQSKFPPNAALPPQESKRVRTFANIYIVSSLGLFAFGVILVLAVKRFVAGLLLLLGALSLLLIGLGMRRFVEK